MALANDNWYGYVQEIIARMDVKWIECACASISWTTQVIYQLEEPHGHLIQNDMRGPHGRTAVRGNMFSFTMPMEEILQSLEAAVSKSAMVPMPHDGHVLSLLVRLHLVNCNINIAKHVKELEIRAEVVINLIRELISRGFPGYENYCVDDVERRTRELFGDGSTAGFVPKEVMQEVKKSAKVRPRSNTQAWDKNATPSEPASANVRTAFDAVRPQHIVAERDGDVGIDVNASRNVAFGEFGESDLVVQTGSDMIDQWKSTYLCAAMPFTMALPVGGHDVRGESRWRRPASAAVVTLEDLVKGLPRRVEAQFRRHWWFTPALWNLYFRERVNFSKHLSLRHKADPSNPTSFDDQDAALSAKRIYHRLETGTFTDAAGKRRPIAGDTSKVLFADGTTKGEQGLLRNVEFVSSSIPGTQAIRRRMGQLGFSASVVYGSGLFMTISPSERHNGLAIKLSRYRSSDPLLATTHAEEERRWIGKDVPPLNQDQGSAPACEPDYETRRLILARDPLCAADAFTVLVRVVLARLLGMRMCPDCPHCNQGSNPCQDRFGSNAEPQGGVFGRCDAIYGAVETQRSGTLHYHFKAFIERAHQYKTLNDIATMIKQGLLCCEELKAYHCWISCESYPDIQKHEHDDEAIERAWPTFQDDTQLGRIPDFIWKDKGPHIYSKEESKEDLKADGREYGRRYAKALQHNQSRVQHHRHKKDANGTRKPLAACQDKQHKGECKHGFPKTKVLTDKALVVCPGVAQKCGLRTSGRRNALGSILPSRNSPWLNGTHPAFTVAFGFNTDTSPNDRLPIIEETHDVSCTRSCCKSGSTSQVSRATHRAQILTDGYFGGYIVKAQPVGRYELKKCTDHMQVLRERIAVGLTPADQVCAVTRRVLTDLEMKGVLRGSVEVDNLCVNLRKDDSLFQECIRTFQEVSLPGGAFLNRLETELHGVGGEFTRRIPPTRRPTARPRYATAPLVDAYGFRGLDQRVLYLSPFEFFMYWEIKRVPEPFRKDCNAWSVWCDGGKEHYDDHKHDENFKLIAGKHYKVFHKL